MTLSRREFLAGVAAAVAWPALADPAAKPKRTRLGVALASYSIRSQADRAFRDPLPFLAFCRERGAGGVQLPIPARDQADAAKLRAAAEAAGMVLEGSLRTPRDQADVARFNAEVRAAREAGAAVVRTVMLPGRRYETFSSAEKYRRFTEQSWQSLTLAEPVLARHKVHLAVENHKDYRADELVGVVKRLASEYIGVCVDTGNNLALLEDPQATVATLAPWAVSVHLKDMAVQEYEDGFLLSEVPLGEGILDLKQIIATLRKARPRVQFFLEMITRDPLRVPCLTPQYWATFEHLPGRHLAQTLTLVRRKRAAELPRISHLAHADQLKVEDDNVRQCLAYAAENLPL